MFTENSYWLTLVRTGRPSDVAALLHVQTATVTTEHVALKFHKFSQYSECFSNYFFNNNEPY